MSALIACSRAARRQRPFATSVPLPGRAERERHEVADVGHYSLPKLRLRLHHHLPDEIGMARQQAHRPSVSVGSGRCVIVASRSLGRVPINWFCNRGSLNVRFAPKATELLRRRELTRCANNRHRTSSG